MSSNLNPSLTASQRSASAHGVDALAGVSPAATLNAKGQSESDNQAFARWMSQYSQASSQASSQVLNPGGALGASALPQASAQASAHPALRETAQKAYQPASASHRVDVTVGHQATPSGTTASAQGENQARAPSGAAAKAPVKTPTKASGAKPAEVPKGDAKSAKASSEAEDGASAQADDTQGTPVAFSTAQGEATAYVKELQPPAHVPTGDPAAMLAWLATLAQAKGMAQPAPGDATGGAQAQANGAAQGLSGTPGGEPGGRQAQPSWAVQGAAQELASFGQGSGRGKEGDAGAGEREGALSLEGLGMSASKDSAQAGDAATFGSLMSQALQRTPEGLARQEAIHQTDTLPTPLSSPEFPQALADKVGLWVADAQDGPMTAELRLNPAEMGPVHIRIELDGQTAHVDFAAQALETRQAIEASLPMLSEALSQAGLSLSGGGVSDQAPQQAWAQAQEGNSSGRNGGRSVISGPAGLGSEGVSGPEPTARLPRGRAGGLDLYA